MLKQKTILFCAVLLLAAACSAPAGDGSSDQNSIATMVAEFQTATARAGGSPAGGAQAPTAAPAALPTETAAPAPTSIPATVTPKPLPFRLPENSVWFAPNFASADFTDLFTRPDAWTAARSQVDVIQFYTQSVLNDPCAICGDNLLDAFVEAGAFSRISQWNIAIALEVGAVKEWGCTGQRGYEVADFVIQNVQNNGGEVAILSMDEPRLYGETPECSYTVTEIAERTAYFMDSVHAKYPAILIGDVEPYPHYSVEELEAWITELERQGVKPAFFHLDVDVERVRVEGQNVTAALAELNQFFEDRGIPFGVIFTSNWKYAGSDQAYYQSTMQWVRTVYEAIGRPSDSIFQSWQGPSGNGLHDVPINLPENDPNIYSHTRLILDGLAILKP